MRFRIKGNKGKIFFRFLISYFLVLLIPLTISTLAYNEAVKIVEKKAIQYNMSMLEQSKDIIDQRLNEINSLVIQLGLNPKVNSLINMGKLSEGSPYIYHLWDLLKDMAPYLITNNFISDFYIYYKDSNIIVSRDKVYTRLSQFYGYFFKYSDMSLQEWEDGILNKFHYKEYLPAQDIKINEKSYSMITYIQSIPLEFPRENKGVIMVTINEEEIRKLLEPINIGQGGWAYISDGNNRVISKFSRNARDIRSIQLNSQGKSGFAHEEIDGQDMIVSFTTSQNNGWKFVTAIPSREVMSEVGYIKNIIYVIMALSLLLGALAAYFLASRNSRPIRTLVKTLRDIIESEPQKGASEYDFLQRSVYQLVNNNKKLKAVMSEQNSLLKLTFFDRLLKGEFNSQSQIEIMQSHIDLYIKGSKYSVAILKINDYNMEVSRESLEKLDMIRLIVRDVLSRHIRQNGFSHEIDESRIAVLLFTDSQESAAFEESIGEAFREVEKELLHMYGIKVSCAGGGIYENLIDVNHSYNEAKLALEYYVAKEQSGMVWFKSIPKNEEGYYYPIYIELRIINLVKSGNIEEVEVLLDSIYTENFSNRKLPLTLIQQVIYEMRGTIVKLLDQINVDFPAECMPSVIQSVKEAKEAYDSIVRTFREICTAIHYQTDSNTQMIKTEILKYIEGNFSNCTLCLSELATKFGYTESSLYHLFKNLTSSTFSDYLENMRIRHACKLLKASEASIKEISELVGYNNDTTFRRAFKRNQGMGPSEYRMEYCK